MIRTRTQMAIVIAILLAFIALQTVFCTGCATTGGRKDFDTCKALSVAQSGHEIANGASGIVCNLLKGEAKRKCLENRSKAAAAASIVISLAQGIAKACGL